MQNVAVRGPPLSGQEKIRNPLVNKQGALGGGLTTCISPTTGRMPVIHCWRLLACLYPCGDCSRYKDAEFGLQVCGGYLYSPRAGTCRSRRPRRAFGCTPRLRMGAGASASGARTLTSDPGGAVMPCAGASLPTVLNRGFGRLTARQ